MSQFTATDLLNTWEYARPLGRVERGLRLIELLGATDQRQLPLGNFNRRLLRLHRLLFGEQLECVANCPACAEQLEFALDVAALGPIDEAQLPPSIAVGDDQPLTMRMPTVGDLLDADGDGDRLFALLGDRRPASSDVRQQAALALQQLDPLLAIELRLACPACGHTWLAPLDLPHYLWRKIEQWAWATLYDVHRLALAYGWRERDILSLSRWRRGYYLSRLT